MLAFVMKSIIDSRNITLLIQGRAQWKLEIRKQRQRGDYKAILIKAECADYIKKNTQSKN